MQIEHVASRTSSIESRSCNELKKREAKEKGKKIVCKRRQRGHGWNTYFVKTGARRWSL